MCAMSMLRDRLGFALVLCVITLVAGRAMAQDGTEETTGGVAPNSTVPPLTPTTPPPAPPATLVPPAFESPAATLETFTKAMNAEAPDYERALETMDLSEVSEEAGQGVAISLLRCLNRIELIDFENDPTLLSKLDLEKPMHRTDTSFTFFPRVKSRYGSERRQHERAVEAAELTTVMGPWLPSTVSTQF